MESGRCRIGLRAKRRHSSDRQRASIYRPKSAAAQQRVTQTGDAMGKSGRGGWTYLLWGFGLLILGFGLMSLLMYLR